VGQVVFETKNIMLIKTTQGLFENGQRSTFIKYTHDFNDTKNFTFVQLALSSHVLLYCNVNIYCICETVNEDAGVQQ